MKALLTARTKNSWRKSKNSDSDIKSRGTNSINRLMVLNKKWTRLKIKGIKFLGNYKNKWRWLEIKLSMFNIKGIKVKKNYWRLRRDSKLPSINWRKTQKKLFRKVEWRSIRSIKDTRIKWKSWRWLQKLGKKNWRKQIKN